MKFYPVFCHLDPFGHKYPNQIPIFEYLQSSLKMILYIDSLF